MLKMTGLHSCVARSCCMIQDVPVDPSRKDGRCDVSRSASGRTRCQVDRSYWRQSLMVSRGPSSDHDLAGEKWLQHEIESKRKDEDVQPPASQSCLFVFASENPFLCCRREVASCFFVPTPPRHKVNQHYLASCRHRHTTSCPKRHAQSPRSTS